MKLMRYQVYVRNDYEKPFNERCLLVFKKKCWNSWKGVFYREYYILKNDGESVLGYLEMEVARFLSPYIFSPNLLMLI